MNDKKFNSTFFVIATLLLFILAKVPIQIFRPLIIDISHHYKISHELARLSITSFIFTFGIGQLFSGYIVRIFSLRNTLIVSISLVFITCIIGWIGYPLYSLLVIGRALQGFALGLTKPICYTIIKLSSKKERSARYFGLASSISIGAVIIFILAAGWLADHHAWRDSFLILSLISLTTLILTSKYIPFDIYPSHSYDSSFKRTKASFMIFKNMKYVSALLCITFIVCAVLLLEIITPTLYMKHMNKSATDYSIIAIYMKCAFVVAAGMSGFFVEKLNYNKVILLGSLIIGISSLCYLIFAEPIEHYLYSIICLLLINFGAGLATSPCTAYALGSIPKEMIPSASSYLGFSIFSISVLPIIIFGSHNRESFQQLFIHLLALGCISSIIIVIDSLFKNKRSISKS